MNVSSHVSIKDFVDGNVKTGFLTPFTILDVWVVNFTVVYITHGKMTIRLERDINNSNSHV